MKSLCSVSSASNEGTSFPVSLQFGITILDKLNNLSTYLRLRNLKGTMPALRTDALIWIFLLLICSTPTLQAADKPAVGDTRVAKWKDDTSAAFLLMFDDSWPSHWQVAAPELVKRKLTATFYICPEKDEYKKFAKEWEETLWKQGMVYGNHTMTHKGVKDPENADWEIGECARVIRKIIAADKDRLVSFAQPGVGPKDWNISKKELEEVLKRHHLINRPTFDGHGAFYHLKTAEEMLALADTAIKAGGMEYLVIHGVERIKPDWGYQDFWPLKQEIFVAILDGLKERQDKGKLWITDHISMHQYETERTSAEVRLLKVEGRGIQLELKCKADPRQYDLPLTLVTRVPADWKRAKVTQGKKVKEIEIENGEIRFDALPDDTPISVER
jgi:peptidoglycan/xylan/chitin deacetylase (PgdA/CDA1 family)